MRYKKSVLMVMTLTGILLGALACSNNGDNGNNENVGVYVDGRIVLGRGNPIAGIRVYSSDHPDIEARTDNRGYFLLGPLPAEKDSIVIDAGIFSITLGVDLDYAQSDTYHIVPTDSALDLVERAHYRILVVDGTYDHIQSIFQDLGMPRLSSLQDTGKGYIVVEATQLSDTQDYSSFNLIAINCGAPGPPPGWENVFRNYLEAGGNAYVSDWAYTYIDSTVLGFTPIEYYGKIGFPGEYRIGVVNPELRAQIGKDTVSIYFDMDYWMMIKRLLIEGDVLLKGDVRDENGEIHQDTPIAVKFKISQQGGEILYTSFHYEAQNTNEDMRKILMLYLLNIGGK